MNSQESHAGHHHPQLHSLPPHHHHQQPSHGLMGPLPHHHHQQDPYAFHDNDSASSMIPQQQNRGFTGFEYSQGSSEAARKKRGRPRKYSPDGNIDLGLSPPTPIPADSTTTPSSLKKLRGRPPTPLKLQLDALGSAGVGFTPHVIMVNVGEDIASKLMAFSEQGPRTICVLSAHGAICNVTLRQSAMGGATVTYEGRFEIISLSGSFTRSESNNSSGTSSLSVSLAGSDYKVLGGGVSGMLKAATPVQVIVGSFITEGKKPKSSSKTPSSLTPPPPSNMLNFGAPSLGVASPPSQEDASSHSSDENGTTTLSHEQGGPYGQPLHGMPMYANMGWSNNNVKMVP